MIKRVESGDGEAGNEVSEGGEYRLPGLLYADDLVLSGEFEEDLKVMAGRFVEVRRGRGLIFNVDKRKVMMSHLDEGLKCKIHVVGARLDQMSEFKYLGCVLDESSTDDAKCRRKVAGRRKVACAIRSLVNPRGLQPECARVLHEGLLVHVLLYNSETMVWRKKN